MSTITDQAIFNYITNNPYNKIIKQELLNYVTKNPYPNTHCIIGSAVRNENLDEYIPKIQQILPPFLDLTMPTRLINFDPRFDTQFLFLHQYFDSKQIGFIHDDSEGVHIWRSEDNIIEVIIINYEFNYSSDEWFLQGLIDSALAINVKLIVQDYTGNDTSDIFKQLFNQSNNKDAFKKNILFDFTYGNNHCDVDLEKYKPIVDSDGNFINIMLMTVDELMPLLHSHPMIDEHIHSYYIKKYREIVNIIPVDYRRKMNNVTGFVGFNNLYTINNSFEEIINILKIELEPVIKIFRHVGLMNPEKEILLNELITNYKNYTLTTKPDIYWWSVQFYKISSI